MSAGVPTMPGIDDPLADARRVVVDEADDAVGELVLVENLPRRPSARCRRCRRTSTRSCMRIEPVSWLNSSRQPRIATRKTNSADTKMPSPIISDGSAT